MMESDGGERVMEVRINIQWSVVTCEGNGRPSHKKTVVLFIAAGKCSVHLCREHSLVRQKGWQRQKPVIRGSQVKVHLESLFSGRGT